MRFLSFILLIAFQTVSAQKHEFGLSLGATNYKGDFTNDNFEIRNYKPALLGFYKNNITPAFGLRYHLLVGGIGSNDKNSPDPVYVKRDRSFSNILFEGALQIEYNFLNYRSESNRMKWSPYFIGGLGVFYSSPSGDSSQAIIAPCIPVGVGLRCQIGQRWNIGIEAAARKTFTDLLDNANGDVPGGNRDTRDWYLYNGIMISYTFYNIYCPRPKR